MSSSKANKVDLKAYFNIRVVNDRGTPKAKYRTCEYDKALNPSRLRDHVNTCPGLRSQQQQGERTASLSRPGFTRQQSIRSYTQSTIVLEKQRLNELAAEWIFYIG